MRHRRWGIVAVRSTTVAGVVLAQGACVTQQVTKEEPRAGIYLGAPKVIGAQQRGTDDALWIVNPVTAVRQGTEREPGEIKTFPALFACYRAPRDKWQQGGQPVCKLVRIEGGAEDLNWPGEVTLKDGVVEQTPASRERYVVRRPEPVRAAPAPKPVARPGLIENPKTAHANTLAALVGKRVRVAPQQGAAVEGTVLRFEAGSVVFLVGTGEQSLPLEGIQRIESLEEVKP